MRTNLGRAVISGGVVLVLTAALAPGAPSELRAQEDLTPREIAASITPAVVKVIALDARGAQRGSGTGFFVDDRGTFVTNHHVVEGASSLRVELASGETYDLVYLLMTEPARDIALLMIPAEGTPQANLGADRELAVGDPVFVMGNPLGLDRTFSDGLVSARRVVDGTNLIQITAPISPGSSGGPVMNARGEVIGVATAYLEGGQNLNMAVPVRYVRPLLALEHTPVPWDGAAAREQAGAARVSGEGGATPGTRIDISDGDQWTRQVLTQLAGIEDLALENGLVRSHDVGTGALAEGGIDHHPIRLESGYTYLFTGACDEDCRDLDLFLYDPRDKRVATQVDVTDVPMMSHAATSSGEYVVRVRMYACSVEPCRYGIAVFREP